MHVKYLVLCLAHTKIPIAVGFCYGYCFFMCLWLKLVQTIFFFVVLLSLSCSSLKIAETLCPIIFRSVLLVNQNLAKDSSLNLDFLKEKRGKDV